MKKTTFSFLSFLSLLFISTLATAQYVSPGTGVTLNFDDIATASPSTISVDGDEYTVYEDITISENDTLLIDSALTALLDEDVLFTIFGTFIVDGEEVLFTALDIEKPFEGFRFEQGSDITLRDATFENGGGLRVLTEDFLVEWCVFLDIVGGGATTSAVIQLSRGVPVIQHNLIGHNYLPAIGSGANSGVSPYIYDNMILENNLENSNRPQINLGVSNGTDPIRIIENMIIGDEDSDMVGGIAISNFIGGTLEAEIADNIIAENRYGITVIGTNDSVKIHGNIIEFNDNESNPMMGGSGISLTSTGLDNPIQIYENEIRGNLWGITVIDDSAVNLGDGDENPGGNIFDENGNNGEIYALYNNSPHDILAKNNCWIEGHEATPEDVEAVIFHKVDDPDLGEVFFDPFLCGTMDVADYSFENFNFYPNPSQDEIHFNNNHGFETVSIYGVQGNLIQSKTIVEGLNSLETNLTTGVYFVKFSGINGTITKKLLVQ